MSMMNPFHVICEALELGSLYMTRAYLGIKQAQDICHQLARKSGWWDDHDAMPEEYRKFYYAAKRELIHSEISEALEGARKGLMDSHLPHRSSEEVELADAIIRIFDYAGARDMDLAGAVVEKLAYNQQRADHKRENRAAEGGKKF